MSIPKQIAIACALLIGAKGLAAEGSRDLTVSHSRCDGPFRFNGDVGLLASVAQGALEELKKQCEEKGGILSGRERLDELDVSRKAVVCVSIKATDYCDIRRPIE